MEPAKLKRSPKAIGECSEAMVLARLVEVGYTVLKPFGDSKRYDLMIEYEI